MPHLKWAFPSPVKTPCCIYHAPTQRTLQHFAALEGRVDPLLNLVTSTMYILRWTVQPTFNSDSIRQYGVHMLTNE
jgi:hypothetical protein